MFVPRRVCFYDYKSNKHGCIDGEREGCSEWTHARRAFLLVRRRLCSQWQIGDLFRSVAEDRTPHHCTTVGTWCCAVLLQGGFLQISSDFRPGCQLHFSWRIVNCASRECGAAQPLATLGFRALRRWWLWICWRWELLSWPLPESDEFQGRNIRPQLNTRKLEWRHVATGKTTRSQGPAISVEECQHLSCCKTTGSESRYKI